MKILIISNFYPPGELGGWEQLTNNVADKLIARGHDIRVLTSNFREDEIKATEPHVKRVLFLESQDPVHYHPHYTLIHRWQERKNLFHLEQALSEFEPEIIFINGMWNLPYTVARGAEQLLPGKVIYYLASYWPTELDAHSAYWMDNHSNSWRRYPKQVMGSVARKVFISPSPRNRLDFRMVLCVSRFVQDYIVNKGGVPRERTRVVHNGIELELFTFNQRPVANGGLRLLYAGRLAPAKGTHTVIESLACIREEFPGVNVGLSIYGTGDPDYEAQLRRQVEVSHLQDRVAFRGLVPREQMPAVFSEHDVLLFPSIWPEPLARIVQEAMACGLVVLGTDTGGTNEILTDGENGLIFEAENPSSLAAKIAQVARDPEDRARLALAARRTVEERFTLDRMVDEILDSFRQISQPAEYALE